jgi:hypothetical protein
MSEMTIIETGPTQEQITDLESVMRGLPQVELGIRHYLVHKTETIGILSKGKMRIWREDATSIVVEAPYTHVGRPGVKRIGYALDDVLWTTFHATSLTDLAQIEEEQFIVDSGAMFDFATGKVKDLALQESKLSYANMLTELGETPETVRSQSERTEDLVNIALEEFGLAIQPSEIEGLGVFCLKSFAEGDAVAPASLRGFRTQVGRYTNHSFAPNALACPLLNGSVLFMASRTIASGEELTVDYRQVREQVSKMRGAACLV